jgi:hypothetical protein
MYRERRQKGGEALGKDKVQAREAALFPPRRETVYDQDDAARREPQGDL